MVTNLTSDGERAPHVEHMRGPAEIQGKGPGDMAHDEASAGQADAVGPGALAPAGTHDTDALTQAAVWRLDEAERSVRWLEGVQGMDEYDLALTLGLTEAQAAELATAATEHLSGRAEAAHLLLVSIEADLPQGTAEEARSTWRSWVATVAAAPVIAEPRDRRPLAARLEPVATRVLRGAPVVLLVAGAAGIALNDGSDSTTGRSRGTNTAGPASGDDGSAGTRIGAPDLGTPPRRRPPLPRSPRLP